MSVEQAHQELNEAWTASYSPERNRKAIDSIRDEPINERLIHFVMRLFFRGIYFPQMTKLAWIKLLAQNRGLLFGFTREAILLYLAARKRKAALQAGGVSAMIDEENA
jgi:hypothetical protein